MRITYVKCVFVALVVQHTMRMRHIIWHYHILPRYHKRHDFREKQDIEHQIRVLIFCTTFV